MVHYYIAPISLSLGSSLGHHVRPAPSSYFIQQLPPYIFHKDSLRTSLPSFSATPFPPMEMYCQSSAYVVCPDTPMSSDAIYPSDRSSPTPVHPITPHTPCSVNFVSQSEQVYTDNLYVPGPSLSSSPSSSSGTVSSRDSSPYSSPVERLVGDDYSYPYVSFVEPQQYVFYPP